MQHSQDDTIVALATAAGTAGLAVVRLAGPAALQVGVRLFEGADLEASESYRAHHGWVHDAGGERLDEVLALVLHAPHGYTGEDSVEFSCHGSPQVVDELVQAAVSAGARLAEPGEFTRRAFLNGKLDLTQAEAVAELIASSSHASLRAALQQLRGRLTERLRPIRQELLDMLADIEASIDFVEEGIAFFGRDEAHQRSTMAMQGVEALLATAPEGRVLRSGIRVSLAGSPNVGKSCLFNCILESPRSIVTEHAGTTRDIVRETLRLGGITLELEDTAGLRGVTGDPVEAIGIERSRASHAEADLLLLVLEAGRAPSHEERLELQRRDRQRSLVILNKKDLLPVSRQEEGLEALLRHLDLTEHVTTQEAVLLSAETGQGVERLLDVLQGRMRALRLSLQNDALVTINQRHQEALVRCRGALQRFDRDIEADEPPEILAADLRGAVLPLGEITGEDIPEEILDSIFARFCVGK
jgi:tRNA modification GTPase